MSKNERTTLPIVLHNPKILLIGAGKVGLQKAEVMQRNGILFTTIAMEVDEGFGLRNISVIQKPFTVSDLQGYAIVIDASGNESVTQTVLDQKAKHRFLLNVVDQPVMCDFFFAALIERGPLKVAVTSSGASPTIAQTVRNRINDILPEGLSSVTQQSMLQRQQGIIDIPAAKAEANRALAKVYLIGCGTGDVELLTIKAYRLIQEVDVVLIDKLVSEEIVALIPEKTKKVYVGKSKGEHSMKQEQINTLLLEYAQKGLQVARLKSGDPFIFGRGSEEALAMVEAGIAVEVIPGISSSLAGPMTAGIAPTARGFASGLSIVSAHLADHLENLDWVDLLLKTNHTTIVLMGLSKAKQISERALAMGVDPDMDVALISNASRPNQKSIVTTLKQLPETSLEVERPAIMVFGDVVKLHELLPSYKRNSYEQTAASI